MLQVPVQAYSPHQLPLHEMEDTIFSQETASAASASKALQKPRKMRASCDACSRAKVRLPIHTLVVNPLTSSRSSVTK